MVLLSCWLLTRIMDRDPVFAMSFRACGVNSAGAVARMMLTAPVCRSWPLGWERCGGPGRRLDIWIWGGCSFGRGLCGNWCL